MLRVFGGFVLIVSLLVGGCGTSAVAPDGEQPQRGQAEDDSEFRLGFGDVVQINVWKNEDLSVQVPVRPDGFISVPLLGDVPAGGRTPEETAREIEARLAKYIRSPNVSVIVTELNSAEFLNRVRVVGAVAAPRSITYREGMTVLDLVLEAGGFNEFAAPQAAKLYRKTDEGTKIYPVYLKSILEEGKLSTNYGLAPGDVVSIPERRF